MDGTRYNCMHLGPKLKEMLNEVSVKKKEQKSLSHFVFLFCIGNEYQTSYIM